MPVHDPRIDALLEKWEELRDTGAPVTAAELCHDFPDLLPELNRRIEQILSLEPFIRAGRDSSERGPSLPQQIGQFHVLREIARGGMGIVYRCRQQSPPRDVAVKVMGLWRVSATLLARFLREVQVLGMLRHPGIAQIYEAGTTNLGLGEQPFFAMELVDGKPIDAFVREHALQPNDCLRLLTRVAEAIQHAHVQGVIHRDLKPANILVNEQGEPKIVDFGVARLVAVDSHPLTSLNEGSVPLGSLPYMSPEQARGDSRELDPRCDVYAMGVIAYQLLTGTLPYDCRRGSLVEKIRVIEETAPKPLGAIDRAYRGDLETIVGKALAKERKDRYLSIAEFAGDIHRFLRQEPVMARPASFWYRVQKFCRRNRALVIGTVLLMASLVLGLAGTTIGLVRAQRAEREAVARGVLAKSSFELARRFVDDYGNRVRKNMERQNAGLPAESLVSSEMLEQAVSHWRQLAASSFADDEVNHELAKALLRAAGQRAPSKRAANVVFLRESVSVWETLSAKRPANPEYDQFLATALMELCEIADPPENRRLFERALTLRRELAEKFPDQGYDHDLAVSCFNYAVHFYYHGQIPEGLAAANEACDLRRRRLEKHPDDDLNRELLALALALGARLNQQADQHAVAEGVQREVCDLARLAVQKFPEELRRRLDLCVYLNDLGHLQAAQGKRDSAAETYLEAGLVLSKGLELERMRTDPSEALDVLADTYRTAGETLAEQNRHDEASEAASKSLKIRQEQVAIHPNRPAYRGELGLAFADLAMIETKRRNWQEANVNYQNAANEIRAALKEVDQSSGSQPQEGKLRETLQTVLDRQSAAERQLRMLEDGSRVTD